MKLLRYGDIGQEKPGVLDSEGNLRDLSNIISDIDGDFLSRGGIDEINKLDLNALPKVSGSPHLECRYLAHPS